MKRFQVVMMVSVVVSSFGFLLVAAASEANHQTSASSERRLSLTPHPVLKSAPPSAAQAHFIYERKARVQRVLLALDRVAAATLQMKPETASRLEPVIVDLAEQAVDLSSEEALSSPSTDAILTHLEETVSHLIQTMSRVVEPEISL